jgi:hypothetical protein
MKKIYLLLFATVLTLGCNKMETADLTEDNSVHFNVEHPATRATDSAFEVADKIGVYIAAYEGGKVLPLQIGGNYKSNIPLIYDGRKWNSDPIIYWDDNIEKYNVYAYYPYCIPTSVTEMPFSVALDQNKDDGIISAYEASDFLYASSKGVTSVDGEVNLLFKHKMSKLTVNIVKGENYDGDIPEAASLYIHSTVPDCLIDLSTGDVVKNPTAQTQTIIAKQVYPGTFTAIVVPQMINSKDPLIEIICNEVSYLVTSRFYFKSGTHHTINIVFDKNPEKVKIEIGGEIVEGWS